MVLLPILIEFWALHLFCFLLSLSLSYLAVPCWSADHVSANHWLHSWPPGCLCLVCRLLLCMHSCVPKLFMPTSLLFLSHGSKSHPPSLGLHHASTYIHEHEFWTEHEQWGQSWQPHVLCVCPLSSIRTDRQTYTCTQTHGQTHFRQMMECGARSHLPPITKSACSSVHYCVEVY